MVVVLAPLEHGVDGNGDGTDPNRAQEGRDPTGTVVADDQDALFAPDPKVF